VADVAASEDSMSFDALAARLGWTRGDPADLFGIDGTGALDWLLGLRPAWMADAECAKSQHRGVNFWPRQGEPNHEAIAVCAKCQVVDRCRDWALGPDNPTADQGIAAGLAGLTAGARRRLRAERRNDAPT
jgi:hypothetical protein